MEPDIVVTPAQVPIEAEPGALVIGNRRDREKARPILRLDGK
jgi:hypothetical protein